MGSIPGAWDPSRVHGIHLIHRVMVKVPWSHAVLMLRGTKIMGKSLQILRVFRICIICIYIYIICVYIYIT